MITFQAVTDAYVNHYLTEATRAELAAAHAAGATAYDDGESAAPALNVKVRSMVGHDTPVGSPRTLGIFRAFGQGYQSGIDADMVAQGMTP